MTEKDLFKTTALSAEEMAKIRALKRAREKAGQFSLLIYSRDGVQAVPLAEGRSLVIGRSPPADVTVRDNSLSRRHASVELAGGEIWVEDLGSTNGTWVDGEKIERVKVEPGGEITFGAVTASVHTLKDHTPGLQSHDRFQQILEAEAARARAFGRSLALLMLRPKKRKEAHVSRWFPQIEEHQRPFDLAGLYSSDTVELLLPEADEARAREFAEAVSQGATPLLCGLGVLPDHAASAEELLDVTRSALQRANTKTPFQTATPLDEPAEEATAGLVVHSQAMQEVYKTVERLAATAIPVLIIGETGTGKEVVARAVHQNGKRKDKPIRCVNCGGIPSQLVESTLFGHEKGAFTGAEKQSAGVFESADGGTVLLDEIGELPPAAQAALLRVLETKRFTRVGSTKEIEVDVRILAATNRDLEAMVKSSDFREDLLYRLNAMTLKLPPLRDRLEEIEPLTRHFMRQAAQANDLQIDQIDPDALSLLKRYSWPGNVRELRNAIERAVVIAQEKAITTDDLPERVRDLQPPEPAPEPEGDIDLKVEVNRYEAKLIVRALDRCKWDRTVAAQTLGIPLRTLSHKMQVYGIKKR
jgi:DNA-binding NtrC family response regulator